MRWRKLGRVFCPEGNAPWMMSHAANPCAVPLDGTRVRIYFSCRDDCKRSHIAFVEIDLTEPIRVLLTAPAPVLGPGLLGTFDDSGVSLGCVVPGGDGRLWLYYVGWNLGQPAPWHNSIGLARLDAAGERAERHSLAPLLDRSPEDPLTLSYPWVLREDGRWRMWYGSHLSWGDSPPESMVHVLKYAESRDGLVWRRDGHIAVGTGWQGRSLDRRAPDIPHAYARPCVMRDRNGYRMWYAYRGPSYRIGYAVSPDGNRWEERDHEVGIDVSPAGWDSEMIAYPHVFDHQNRRYLLYCGNGYGRTGFGIAELERG
jgi:hypothetical protein